MENKITLFSNWHNMWAIVLSTLWFAFLLQWLFAFDQLVIVARRFPDQLLSYVVDGTLNFYQFVFDYTPLLILITSAVLAVAVMKHRRRLHTVSLFSGWAIGAYVTAVFFEKLLLWIAQEPTDSMVLTMAVHYGMLAVLCAIAVQSIQRLAPDQRKQSRP